jgi:energy-coupling factor transporter ATP-binding protein EcfA2
MLKLRRLVIRKFRNVRSGTELRFNDGFNVVLGRNASGKTTLLNLISMLVRPDLSAIQNEEFDFEYELAVSSGRLLIEARNTKTVQSLLFGGPVPSGSLPPRFEPSYRVLLELTDPKVECTLIGDPLQPRVEIGGETRAVEWVSPFAPLFFVVRLLPLLESNGPAHGRLEEAVAARQSQRHDEGLGFFQRITGSNGTGGGDDHAELSEYRPPGFPASASCKHRLVPPEFVAAILDLRRQGDLDLNLSVPLSRVPRFQHMVAALGFSAGQWRPTLAERETTADGELLRFGPFAFGFTRADGSYVSHDLLSYGQKRLLSFFYYVAVNEAVVIADEIVNGLHHDWIKDCIAAIGDRQAFLTSQNLLLFDFIPLTSAEQVQQSFVTCRREARPDGREELVWGHLSAEEARELHADYEVGIEHVGEILQRRALW